MGGASMETPPFSFPSPQRRLGPQDQIAQMSALSRPEIPAFAGMTCVAPYFVGKPRFFISAVTSGSRPRKAR